VSLCKTIMLFSRPM